MNSVSGRIGEVVKAKNTQHSFKNAGYEQICEIEEVLAGKHTELPSKNH
jgi:hypothetical protein